MSTGPAGTEGTRSRDRYAEQQRAREAAQRAEQQTPSGQVPATGQGSVQVRQHAAAVGQVAGDRMEAEVGGRLPAAEQAQRKANARRAREIR